MEQIERDTIAKVITHLTENRDNALSAVEGGPEKGYDLVIGILRHSLTS